MALWKATAARVQLPLERARIALWALPPARKLGRVRVRPRLVVYVGALWLAALALAVFVMRWRREDWVGAAVAAVLVAAMAAYAVPSFGAVNRRWSASGFFDLAFSFTVGPPAIATMAVAESVGFVIRRRSGAFRTWFNLADHFLADTAAWLGFQAVAGVHPDPATLAIAGVAGSLLHAGVNRILLTAVLRLADEPAPLLPALSNLVRFVPIAIPFGITAAGAVILYHAEGTWGIVTLLLPLAIVQASMVALARRAHAEAQLQDREAQALKREAQALKREAQALRRAGDASEVERKRIAADLHDSVIQDVTGLLLRSSAMLGRLSDGDVEVWSRERAEAFLNYTRDLAGEAVQELRTLMIELAPPLLDEEGLASALRQLLTRLDREQISWVLECPEEPLDQRHQRLVYRVVQEALRNVVKHAQCRSVWVTVRPQGGRLVASIRDDGRGFSAAERADRRKKGHAGLGLLGQTVRDGGGELTITSVRGKGTTLRLVIPMLPSPALEGEGGDGAGASPTPDATPAGHEHVDDGDADGQAAEPGPSVTGRSRVRKPPERTPGTSVSAP
jgi:signal transduction histidine kinase